MLLKLLETKFNFLNFDIMGVLQVLFRAFFFSYLTSDYSGLGYVMASLYLYTESLQSMFKELLYAAAWLPSLLLFHLHLLDYFFSYHLLSIHVRVSGSRFISHGRQPNCLREVRKGDSYSMVQHCDIFWSVCIWASSYDLSHSERGLYLHPHRDRNNLCRSPSPSPSPILNLFVGCEFARLWLSLPREKKLFWEYGRSSFLLWCGSDSFTFIFFRFISSSPFSDK